jgi:hypothetical protein
MMDEGGSLEGLLAGAGVAVAAAVLMLVILALFRSTGPANSAITLQNLAARVCGDMGTAAIAVIPYNHSETYPANGMTVQVTSDYVIASDSAGHDFARPLPVRAFPGSYRDQDVVFWNDTAEMREYLNRTVGNTGTRERPFNETQGRQAAELMEKACRALAHDPIRISDARPLTVEKLFLYTRNDSSTTLESDSYVFVCQG